MFQSIDPNRHANFNNNNNNNQQQQQNIPVVNTNSAINRQHMANYHNNNNNNNMTNVNNQQQPQQQNYTNFNNNSSPLGSQNLSQQQARVGNNNNNNNNATSSSQNMMMANPSSSASFNPNLPLGLPALRRAFSKLARGGQCDVTPEHLATALRKCEPALRPALESLWARSRHDSRYFISHLQSTTEIALIQGAGRTSLGFETTLYSIVREICPILLSQIRAALQREEELKKNLVAMISMKTTTAAAATENKNNAVSCDGEGQNQEQDDEEQEMSLPMPGPSSNSNMSQQQQRHVDPSSINPIFSAPTTTTTRQNIDYLHRQVTEFFVAVCDYLCDTIALSGATNTQLLSSAIHDTLPSHLWNHYARRRGASESTSMSASTASQAGSPSSNGSSPIDHFSVGGGGSALNSQTRLPRRGNSSSGNNNALPVGDDDSSAGVVAGNTTVTAAGAATGGTPFSGSHYSVSSNGANTSTSAGVIMGGGSGNITHQNNNNNSNNNIHPHFHHHPHAHSHQHTVIEFNIHHFRSLMRSGLSSSNEKRVEECRILLGEVLQTIVTDVEVPMWTNKCPFNGGVASIIHEMIACEHKQLNFDYFTGFSDGERAMSTSAGVGNATATTPPPPSNSANANPTQNNSNNDNGGTVSSTTPPSASVGTSNNNANNATATASHSRHPALNPKMRIVLVDWLHAICSRLRMSDHTFHMNIALLDTALCLQQNITTHQLQLLGIAAMYLASKYHEMFPPQITQFVYMSANAYSVDEILGAERNLFTLLDCRFVFPSALEAADVILIEQDPPATPEQRVIVQFLLHVHLHHTVYGGGGQSILAARAAVFISRVLCGITFASSRQHLSNTSSSSVNGNGQVGNNIHNNQNGRNPIVSISEVPPQTASASPVNPAANNNNNNNNNHNHANNSNAANCSNENSNQHADSNNASAAAANGQNNNNVNTSIISTTSSSSFLLAGRRRTAFNRKNGMNVKNDNGDNKRRSSCSRHRRGRGDEENEDVYDDGQDGNVDEDNQEGRENQNGDNNNNNNENPNIDDDNANKQQRREEEEEDENSFLPSQLLQRNKNNNIGGSQSNNNNNNFNNFFSASADDLPFLVLRNCHLSEREYWYIDKMLNQLQELKNPETKAQDLVTRYGHKKYFFVANRDFDKEKILSVARENIFVGRLFSTSFEIQSDVVRENITNRGTLM